MSVRVRLALWTTAVLLASTTSAQAAVTRSQVTTPSDPTYVLNRLQPTGGGQLHYAGTSDGTVGDTLTVYCTYGPGGAQKLDGGSTTVQADGSFSGSIVLNATAAVGLQTCVLRAMPDAHLPTTSFTGPRVAFSQVDDEEDTRPYDGHAGTVGSTPMEFFVAAAQLRGYAEWRSVSSCGLTYSYPYADDFSFAGDGMVASQPLFNCAGALYVSGTTDPRSEIRVDGVSVVTGGAVRMFSRNRTALDAYPEPTRTYRQDPDSGDVTIVETEPLGYCRLANDSATLDPPDSRCHWWRSAGVRLVRTIHQYADGRQMSVTDSFVNEDDHDHTITAIYDQHVGRDATPETGEGPTQPTFSFDGGAYRPRATGTIVTPGPQAPGIIGIQGNPSAGPGLHNPQGSILYTTAPSEIVFTYANDTVTDANTDPQPDLAGTHAAAFEMHYERPLPASGSVQIEHVYTQGTVRRDVDALTAAYAAQSSAPELKITTPRPGATVTTPAVTLRGTASDRFTTVRLTVNGRVVPVVDGRWSTTLVLRPGVNAITAVATNGAGRQTQVQQTVVYTPLPLLPPPTMTPPPAPCVVPLLTGTPEALARTAIVRAGCTVGKVRRHYSTKVRRGRVISSSLLAGRYLGPAFPVDLTVSRGPASSKFSVRRVKVHRKKSGRIDVRVHFPGAGRYEVLGTYGPPGGRRARSRTRSHSGKRMKPGPRRRVYRRRTGKVHRAKTVVVRLTPTKRARATLRLHRKRGRTLTVRVHVRFAPVDGRPARRMVKKLRVH